MSARALLCTLFCCLLEMQAAAQTQIFTKDGDAAGDYAGYAVAVVGDVDADGKDDYAIGSPNNDVAGSAAGMVRVYSGASGATLFTWYGTTAGDRFGSCIARVGDLDGDGHHELAVGAPFGGGASVYSGASGALLFPLVGLSGQAGFAIAGGGDVDGDNVPDILVGSPNHGGGGLVRGGVSVFSGASGALLRTHVGTCDVGYLGRSLCFLDDMNGDGAAEYALGQPASYDASCDPKVFAFDGATGAELWVHSAATQSDQLGFALARLADVNGDGKAEVLAGAPQDPGVGCGPCNGKGYVQLLDGQTGNTLWQIDGTSIYAGLGFALTPLGDLDGNGWEDFAVSQPATEGCDGNTRDVQVRDGLAGALLVELERPALGDNFGYGLASGDANGDGLLDLIVGTPCANGNGVDAGAVYAYTIVWQERDYCLAKTNSQGCTPTIYATGVASYAASTLRVRASGVINNKAGMMFWGRTPAATPFAGGHLCVKAPIQRTAIQSSGGNPPPDDCSGTYSFHLSTPFLISNGILVGEQIYCEYWYRDPSDALGIGLSDGLALRIFP